MSNYERLRQLEREAEQIRRQIKIEERKLFPITKTNMDFSSIVSWAESYRDEYLRLGSDYLCDDAGEWDRDIAERVINIVFGNDFWNWANKQEGTENEQMSE